MRKLFGLALFSIVFFGSPASAGEGRTLFGTVVDVAGNIVVGAKVVLVDEVQETTTDAYGRFTFANVGTGAVKIRVTAPGWKSVTADIDGDASEVRFALDAGEMTEAITVLAPRPRIVSATRTETPLRDVPQSITVITRAVMEQQTMQNMADVVRYVPGIGIAQGEGNRDTPVFRGNSSTSDFFVDGVRDDVQYFRDVYNVERVEALKGPNAMIFGRGGVGGVLNRVTRQAEWTPSRELTLQGGSWNNRRVMGDFGHVVTDNVSARVTGVYESSDSYREGAVLQRQGINPTVAFALGSNTMLRAGYEYFRDGRTADRGISSFRGRPVATDASTFFGNADLSNSTTTVNALSASLDHRFSDRSSLRSRISYGDYDKFYQNVFPGAVDATGSNVSISAYNNATQRRNVFGQTDWIVSARTGSLTHTMVAGVEIGRQVTDNFRETGYFTSLGANVSSTLVPLSSPTTSLPMTFRQGASDADNHGVARTSAVYVQDQVVLSPHFQAIAGLRYDHFEMEFRNQRTAAHFSSRDGLVSPRLGLIFKPAKPVSLYASYGLSYMPRAGEQLSSLNLANQALAPEEFRNYELGLKWDVAPSFELATSVYRLDRGNVAVADPVNPAVTTLVDGQRTEGVELSISGTVRAGWSIVGAYAYQEGEITQSLSPTALAGARLAQLPRHTASLWNKVDINSAWGIGMGIVHRDAIFTSTDNLVTVPSFTRVDTAIYFSFSERLRAQVNVENLFDTSYYAYAHSNTNITPGSPRAVRVSWTTRF